MPSPDMRVEAARYALMRRMTIAMRHHMVAHLQPIGLATQVMERRLRADTPDIARLGDDMAKVRGFARSAVATNLDMVTWLAPEPGAQVALDAGVDECVDLLRGHFSFRGFQLQGLQEPLDAPVARSAVRTVLPAVLFGLTDDGQAPADLAVRAQREGPTLHVALEATAGPHPEVAHPPYRLLEWKEVEALARAEGVALVRSGLSVRLGFAQP